MNGNHIVCACNGTTAAQIEKAVKEGARTFEEVQEKLRVGVQCVKCKVLVKLLIDSYLEYAAVVTVQPRTLHLLQSP